MNRLNKTLPVLLLGGALLLATASCDNLSLDEPQPQGELDETTFYRTVGDFRSAIFSAYSPQIEWYLGTNAGSPHWAAVVYPSDDLRAPDTSPNDFDNFNWQATAGPFNAYWNESYNGIRNANVVLEQLPDADFEADAEGMKESFRAEARFMRGYYHFVLLRMFGNAPVVPSVVSDIDSTDIGNADQDINALWDLIAADFEAAAQGLPPTRNASNKGRVTSATAYGYLGKVNLFRAQWQGDDSYYQDAISAFNEVVAMEGEAVRLLDDYADNFKGGEFENGAESLYEVQNSVNENAAYPNGNPWVASGQGVGADNNARHIIMRAGAGPGGATAPGFQGVSGAFEVTASTQEFFATRVPSDPRRYESYYVPGEAYSYTLDGCVSGDSLTTACTYSAEWSTTGSTPGKYERVRPYQPVTAWQNPLYGVNERILRYSDVLLMLAEAEHLAGSNARAAELVNQVRARVRDDYADVCEGRGDIVNDGAVGLGCSDDADDDGTVNAEDGDFNPVPDVSAGEVDHALIRGERRVELLSEGKRYEDLVRWHRAGIINISSDIDFGSTTANNSWSPDNLLRPIPQNELDVNPNLVQNPGY